MTASLANLFGTNRLSIVQQHPAKPIIFDWKSSSTYTFDLFHSFSHKSGPCFGSKQGRKEAVDDYDWNWSSGSKVASRRADTEFRIRLTDIALRNFPPILKLSLPRWSQATRDFPPDDEALLEGNKYRGRDTAVAAKRKASRTYYHAH